MEDITKTGPIGLKGLKGINQQSDPNTEYFNSLMRSSGKQIRQTYTPEVSQDIGLRLGEAGYGQSSYDDAIQNLSQLDNIDDVRAEQQPWYAKWGAGLGKGIALAGTTFLDGTIGLIYGLSSAIWNKDAARLWDNQVSNTLQDWNKELEVLLPNYRSREEQERPWYENLGTANFWADSFLKNMGFAVGAFYSGSVWTKGLKAIGWMKGAMAAKGTGSLLQAINEGRIVANQDAGDWKELEYEKLRDKYEELYNFINSQPDTLVLNPETGVAESSKQKRLAELQDNLRAEQASIDERAKKMGLTTLIGNIVLLSLDNLNTFGKLYARGFKNSRTISNGARGSFKEGLRKAGIELAEGEAGVGIRKEAGKYVFDKVSNKRALGRGLKIGLIQGNEELAQAFISETAGNMQTYDSPDAYYLALTDRNAELKTKDFMTSAIEGFANTYGNGDRYEEFAVGALTSIIGIPTFGRVNNSDHNTYLGRGKMIGLSGGLFGEFSNAKYQNVQGEDAVQGMNKFVDKLKTQQGYFVQSQSFTNAMDGWSDENDAFEFKNAEDNDDFAAISRFAKAGRLSDLIEMVNQDFEGISDEQLADIATNTTSQFGGWRSTDGTLMSDTQEGRDLMRNELSLKRDKILSEIDRYEKSVEAVRAIGNNSLTDDQVNELAWLNWKVGKFDERFTSIKQENEPLFTALRSGLEEFRNSIDEDSEEGKKWLNTVNTFNQFLNHLSGSRSSLDMASRLAANPKLAQALTSQDFFDFFADKSGLSFEDYSAAMDNLVDAARLATASKTFNERYKEFKENPIELIKNRQKIDKSKEKVNTASENVGSMDRVRNSSVSDLASAMRDGSFDADAFDSILEGLEGDDVEEQKKKVQEAQAINDGSDQLSQAINAAELEGIDPLEMEAVKRDAQALLNAATESAESLDDLFNTDTEAWLDPRNLPVGEDESINLEEAQERLDAARSLVQQQLAQVKDAAEVMAQVPKSGQPQASPETGSTGHDLVDKTITENERKKKEEEAAAKRGVKVDRTTAYHKGVAELTTGMPNAVRDRYQQLAAQLLTDLDMLLNKGLSSEEIASVLSASTAYKDLNAANPFINNLLNDYINAHRSEVPQPKPAAPQPAPRIITPVIEAGNTMAVQPPLADMGSSKVGGVYMFLRPSTTELPIHYNGGATTPYHELVKDSGQYTVSELQRMKAVYEYLESHGAFQRVNEGRIKPGDTVGFMIDPALNEKAGDTVILITDKDGKVIGDLPARGSRTFGDYAGLGELVDRIEKEYKETGKITVTTQVDKNFVGKVPTVDTYSTLNAISEGKGFTLGIALEGGNMPSIIIEGGRTKKTRGDRDNQAIRPANAAAGQPFLMLETSSPTRHYYPVPILMKSFGESTQGTQLHKAVEDAVSSILNKAYRPTEVKDDLLDVLALEDAYVEYNGDEVKLRVKKPGQGWEEVFKGVPTPETISEVLKNLEGTPYQVSRKYINGEYKGQSYNDIIGEIAEANLPIGTRHTVSDWFSLKLTNGQKTVSPRTRGENPHRAASVFVTVNYKGTPLMVDTKSWEVSDSTGKVYNGEKADKVKAYAWGLHTNQDMTKPYVSKWGKFDPIKGDFVKSNPVAAPVDDSLLAGLAEAQADLEAFVASREGGSDPSSTQSNEAGIPNVINADSSDLVFVTNTSEQTPNLDRVNNTYAGYFEGGGTNIYTIYPDFNKELHNKYQNYHLGDGEFTEQDAKDFLAEVERNEAIRLKERDKKDAPYLDAIRNATTEQEATEAMNRALGRGIEANTVTPIYMAKRQELASKSAPNPEVAELSSEEARKKVADAGLLNTPIRQSAWDRMSVEAQRMIAAKAGRPKATQWMDALGKVFDPNTGTFDLNKLAGKPKSIEEYLSSKPKFERVDRTDREWNEARERQWLEQALPQLSTDDRLRVHNGLIRISEKDGGGEAYGQFWNGVITVASNAAQGTLYHEAFHAVADTLLNNQEHELLFQAAEEKWGNIGMLALEERMADDFRKYVQLEETPILGKAIKAYRTLKHIVQNLFGKEPFINKVYYNISRGKYASRALNDSNTSKYSETPYSQEMNKIKEKAIKDGTFMKAPNGRPTNLTERQWLQVRTRNFINWFGDWINNPSEASKVIDKNGEPLVVYHGGEKGINIFLNRDENLNYEKTKHQGYVAKDRVGIYFSEYKGVGINYARSYSKKNREVYEVFLNIRNPYNQKMITTKLNTLLNLFRGKSEKNLTPDLIHRFELETTLKNHDGINHSNGTELIVFNSNQIKSATDNVGSFSASNNNIKYSRVSQSVQGLQGIIDSNLNNTIVWSSLSRNKVKRRIWWKNWKQNMERSLDATIKGYEDSNHVWHVASVTPNTKYSRITANEVAQYHRDKLAYGNLEASDRQYLEDRGISREDYNNMSQKEKEVLFHCR